MWCVCRGAMWCGVAWRGVACCGVMMRRAWCGTAVVLRWRMHGGTCVSWCPSGLAGRCQGAAAFRRVREVRGVWSAGGGLVCARVAWHAVALCGVVPRRAAWRGVGCDCYVLRCRWRRAVGDGVVWRGVGVVW